MARIRVLYGTTTGHTAKIARSIADTFAEDFGRRVARETSGDHSAPAGTRVA